MISLQIDEFRELRGYVPITRILRFTRNFHFATFPIFKKKKTFSPFFVLYAVPTKYRKIRSRFFPQRRLLVKFYAKYILCSNTKSSHPNI